MLGLGLKFFASTATKATPAFRIYKGHLIPAKPKAKLNSISHFVQQNKNLKIKEAVQAWKKLGPEERAKFDKVLSEKNTTRQTAIDQYKKQYLDKIKNTNTNAFANFIKAKYQTVDSKSKDFSNATENLKKFSKEWSALSKQQKLKYKPVENKQQTTGLQKFKLPVKPTKTARQYFNESKSGKLWSAVSDKQREEFQKKVEKDQKAYQSELKKLSEGANVDLSTIQKLIKKDERKASKSVDAKDSKEKTTNSKRSASASSKKSDSAKSSTGAKKSSTSEKKSTGTKKTTSGTKKTTSGTKKTSTETKKSSTKKAEQKPSEKKQENKKENKQQKKASS